MKIPLVLAASVLGCCAVNAEESKPNILFIFADDLAFNALQSVDSNAAHTPNIDRLRASGMRFTHAYNQGSWSMAVCVASRTMLNSGYSVWNAQKFEKKRPPTPVWSETMRNNGYETYFTGKWHGPGLRPATVFDHVGTVRGGMPQDTQEGYKRKFIPGEPDIWTPPDTKFGGYWKGGTHWSEVVAKETCGFLADATQRDTPFFMYIAFNAPHDPRQSAQQYLDRYPVDSITVPANFMPKYPYAKQIGCGPGLRDEKLAPFPRTPYSIQVTRHEYYAMITHLDEQIGKILDSLEKSGKRDSTYIIFSADQGLSVGDHGLLGKQNCYEPAIRVPMIWSGPGITPGSESNALIYIQDLVPTLYDIVGIAKPKHLAFKSYRPLLNNPKDNPGHPYIYGAILDFQRMIRGQNYKLLIYPKANIVRLYDLNKDPDEINDLARDPAMRPTVDKLFKALQAQQKSLNDKLNLTPAFNTFFDQK